ncbi:hypothetical protein BJV74DRAFT_798699 [Russula compacta]|nr:hypothetical protein BJV74DRAFT_798699 [Russula compacta]
MGKKKHDEDHVKHDMDSMQTCSVCSIEVRVGTGGPRNFEAHTKGKKHQMNLKAAEDVSKRLKPSLISNFFEKQCIPQSIYHPSPAPQLLAPKPTLASPLHVISNTDNTDMMSMGMISPPSRSGASGQSITHPLMTCLHALSSHLPESVSIGQESKPFAVFSGDLWDSVVAGEDPWEVFIDPSLNHIIRFSMTMCQIADIVQHWHFGVDGFCKWIDICVVELRISPDLLQGKLEHVFDALKLLSVSCP